MSIIKRGFLAVLASIVTAPAPLADPGTKSAGEIVTTTAAVSPVPLDSTLTQLGEKNAATCLKHFDLAVKGRTKKYHLTKIDGIPQMRLSKDMVCNRAPGGHAESDAFEVRRNLHPGEIIKGFYHLNELAIAYVPGRLKGGRLYLSDRGNSEIVDMPTHQIVLYSSSPTAPSNRFPLEPKLSDDAYARLKAFVARNTPSDSSPGLK
jgi:hypothetical protein